ncbi:CU044_5270 family protein [Streptomyces sp. LZ34]
MSNQPLPPDQDELELLRDWDTGAPPLTGRARSRARARLFAAMGGAPAPRRRHPLLRVVVAASVAAAATAGVLVAVNQGSGSDPAQARPTASPRLQNVSARTVLNGAAAFERKRGKGIEPRDDQFIYTKEIIKETSKKTGKTKTYTDENWRSVDGSHRSWVMEIGHGWWSDPDPQEGSSWPPQDWTRLEKLPTDPDKLLIAVRDWAYKKPHYNRPIEDDEWGDIEFGLAGLLYRVPVMPDGLRAAAYEALGRIPGVKATPGEKDAKGREGIAISYDSPHGLSSVFIFDANTYAYLGMRDIRSSDKTHDQYVQRSYLDGYAVVDKVKQRP